jgi:rhomboid family protein
MFLHSSTDLFHIVFNMLALFMLGCDIERSWGPGRFLRYYLLCGVGGGLLNCAFAFQSSTIGASGAIFGLLVAYALMFPTRTFLFWGIFPLTARQLAVLLSAIELFSLGALRPDGVARLAHLGGALTGFLFLKGFWDPRRLIGDLRWRLRRRRFKTIEREESRRTEKDRFYPFH